MFKDLVLVHLLVLPSHFYNYGTFYVAQIIFLGRITVLKSLIVELMLFRLLPNIYLDRFSCCSIEFVTLKF
jgi:hypothetical protein